MWAEAIEEPASETAPADCGDRTAASPNLRRKLLHALRRCLRARDGGRLRSPSFAARTEARAAEAALMKHPFEA